MVSTSQCNADLKLFFCHYGLIDGRVMKPNYDRSKEVSLLKEFAISRFRFLPEGLKQMSGREGAGAGDIFDKFSN